MSAAPNVAESLGEVVYDEELSGAPVPPPADVAGVDLTKTWTYSTPVVREVSDVPGVWSLEMLTWAGTVAGAVHSYGALVSPHRDEDGHRMKYRITRVLSAADIEQIAAHDLAVGRPEFGFPVGSETEQFFSEDSLHAAAVAGFSALCSPGDALVVGSAYPARPLAGGAQLLAALSELWERDETLSDFDPARQDVFDAWEAETASMTGRPMPRNADGSVTYSFSSRTSPPGEVAVRRLVDGRFVVRFVE